MQYLHALFLIWISCVSVTLHLLNHGRIQWREK